MPEDSFENNKATSKNLYLQPEDLELLKRIETAYNVGLSGAAHHIFREFDSWYEKQVKKDFIFYLLYPLIFMVFATITTIFTEKLNNILLEQGYYFSELYILNRIFTVVSFGSISVFIASVYWMRKKWMGVSDGA